MASSSDTTSKQAKTWFSPFFSQEVAGFVVGDELDPLPYLPIVAVLEAVLNLPPICSLSYSNSSLQVASGSTVHHPNTSPKCSIPLPQQALHFFGHPRLVD